MPHLFISGGGQLTRSFLDDDEATATASSHTHSGMNFGPASSNRWLLACLSWASSAGGGSPRTASSVTIGGITATQIPGVYVNSVNGHAVDMWIANVPTGTSGNVAVTLSGNSLTWACALYAIIGDTDGTAFDTANSTANPPSAAIDVKTDGISIGVSIAEDASGPTFTWTNLTEDADVKYGVGNTSAISSASDAYTTDSTVTITATPSASVQRCGGFASFAPN